MTFNRKRTQDEKNRISIGLKKAYSKGIRKPIRLYGENNPFYNKHHSEKTKRKLRKINFKGGYLNKDKRRILCFSRRYIQEHDYIWMKENNFWRMPYNFVIHHLDNNKLNNQSNNLVLLPRGYHAMLHHAFRREF